MTKLLTASLVALMAMSTALPVVLALASPAEAARCSTDKPCTPNDPGDPGGPGGPGGDDDPGGPGGPGGPGDGGDGDGPGSPGDPYIPPDLSYLTADVVKTMLISCRISGTPEAQPNDLKFRNIGDITIPAGTQVYWTVTETGDHGIFALPQDLPVGKAISDLDVLPNGLPTADHCLSKIM